MINRRLEGYKNKKVVVTAGGITYKGVLKEITEEGVNLKGLTGWIEIPMEKISSIKEEGEKDTFNDNRFVDKSFWDVNSEGDEKK